MQEKESLYDRLGEKKLRDVITEFYKRATQDGIIGHFFFNIDHQQLVEKQIAFSKALLGGPSNYQGKGLRAAHQGISVRPAHFDRRQRIMQAVLQELSVDEEIARQWLALEHRLRPLVVAPQLKT